MKNPLSREIRIPVNKQALLIFIATVIVCLILFGYFYFDIDLEGVHTKIQEAPAWIFLGALVFLPPIACPLSIFLVAVGARFQFVYAVLFASLAIIAHHVIAVGISRLVSDREVGSDQATGLWKRLDDQFGGNSSKLLFVWGITPGIPYSVKLYLPLAMGVKAIPYIVWNGLGHVLGAIIFVGFGRTIFQYQGVGTIFVLAVVLVVAGLVYLLRRKVIPDA